MLPLRNERIIYYCTLFGLLPLSSHRSFRRQCPALAATSVHWQAACLNNNDTLVHIPRLRTLPRRFTFSLHSR
jgi:hypothetical protein